MKDLWTKCKLSLDRTQCKTNHRPPLWKIEPIHNKWELGRTKSIRKKQRSLNSHLISHSLLSHQYCWLIQTRILVSHSRRSILRVLSLLNRHHSSKRIQITIILLSWISMHIIRKKVKNKWKNESIMRRIEFWITWRILLRHKHERSSMNN